MKSDRELREDVILELQADARIGTSSAIAVGVTDGIVTLSGTVDGWAKKLAAQEAAHRVADVLDVANDIEIDAPGGDRPTDTELAQAVRHALVWDVYVPHERILSTVDGGIVTLTGTVDTLQLSVEAERAVRYINGVRRVVNQIEVKVPAPAAETVRDAIRAALERHAGREGERIVVESMAERVAVVGAATGMRGVRGVTDHLRVLRPEPLQPRR